MLTKIRNLLHVICDEALEQDYLERNPCKGVTINGGNPKNHRVLSIEDIWEAGSGTTRARAVGFPAWWC